MRQSLLWVPVVLLIAYPSVAEPIRLDAPSLADIAPRASLIADAPPPVLGLCIGGPYRYSLVLGPRHPFSQVWSDGATYTYLYSAILPDYCSPSVPDAFGPFETSFQSVGVTGAGTFAGVSQFGFLTDGAPSPVATFMFGIGSLSVDISSPTNLGATFLYYIQSAKAPASASLSNTFFIDHPSLSEPGLWGSSDLPSFAPVPEASTLLLLVTGLGALAAPLRRTFAANTRRRPVKSPA